MLNAILEEHPDVLHLRRINQVSLNRLDPRLSLLGTERFSELVSLVLEGSVGGLGRVEVFETFDGMGEKVGRGGGEGEGGGGGVVDANQVSGPDREVSMGGLKG